MTWKRQMKNSTVCLGKALLLRSTGWGQKYTPTGCLDALKDVLVTSEWWRNGCHFLSG